MHKVKKIGLFTLSILRVCIIKFVILKEPDLVPCTERDFRFRIGDENFLI